MSCPSCGEVNNPDRLYCARCGGTLGRRCTACGGQNEPGDQFCGRCGTALGATSSPGPAPLRVGREIAGALAHAHARGVIHRDVKPSNVWLTADGLAKLGDFGLALARNSARLTADGLMVGTVAYMPPEQALGRPLDARSDL